MDCGSSVIVLLPGRDEREQRETRGSLFLFLYKNRNRAQEDEEKGVVALLNSWYCVMQSKYKESRGVWLGMCQHFCYIEVQKMAVVPFNEHVLNQTYCPNISEEVAFLASFSTFLTFSGTKYLKKLLAINLKTIF